jgi:hypothetical protein
VPVVYVIYRSYLLYLKQLQTERENAEKERRHAEEIAASHVDTMQALAAATSVKASILFRFLQAGIWPTQIRVRALQRVVFASSRFGAPIWPRSSKTMVITRQTGY